MMIDALKLTMTVLGSYIVCLKSSSICGRTTLKQCHNVGDIDLYKATQVFNAGNGDIDTLVQYQYISLPLEQKVSINLP